MTPDTTIYYDPYDYEIDKDPHPVWRQIREDQPLYWNERYGFWALSRFEDVWAAYHDTTTFSSSHGVQLETLDAPVEHASMIFMDPPEHDRLRQLVSRAFTRRRMRELEVSVTAIVDGYLGQFVGAEQFDYVEQFGALVPAMVIASYSVSRSQTATNSAIGSTTCSTATKSRPRRANVRWRPDSRRSNT